MIQATVSIGKNWWRILIYGGGLSFFFQSGATLGQTVSSAGTPALDEIVVTAQKREERLQDVPIAISAFGPEILSQNRVESTSDIQFLVPALVYNQLGGFAEPFLRGIGTDLTQPNSDPSVATYIDGAFVSNDQATIQNLLGVERIEVLEGPQGTLYGRNAVGGAINVITTTPTQNVDGHVTLTGGEFALKQGSASLSGGVSDTLAVGLYVAATKENSYMETLRYTPFAGTNVNDERNWGARIKAVFTPTEWLKLTGSAEKLQANSHDAATLRNTSPNGLGYLLFPSDPKVIGEYINQSAWPQFNKQFESSYTLREEVSLPSASLVGISNYRESDVVSSVDVGTTPAPLLDTTSGDIKSRQYSQEFQILSPAENPIKWIGGLFIFHEASGFLPNSTVTPILFPPLYSINNFALVTTNAYAVFAQTTLPLDFINRDLRLTLGGRYNIDQKHFRDYQTYQLENGAFGAPRVDYPELHHQWEKFTPKVTLDYKLSDTLIYATYSEGFKSGAYNTTAPTAPGPVNPEDLKAFEIGTKSDFFAHRLRWNNAAYYYDFKNLQVEVISYSTSGDTLLENAAGAKAYGLESSLFAAVTEGLNVNVGVSLEHSKYTEYAAFSGVDPVTLTSVVVDAKGNRLQRTPTGVLTAGADYQWRLPNSANIRATLNAYHNDGFFWTAQNSTRQPGYTLVNSTVEYATPGGRWKVSAWVNNLTNQYYANNVLAESPFGILAEDAPPRTFGLTATVSLK